MARSQLHRVGQVGRRRGGLDRPLDQLRPFASGEQRRAPAQHDGSQVDPQLVGQAGEDALADHVPAAHHEDVLGPGRGTGLIDGRLQPLGDEREVEARRTACGTEWVTTKNGGVAASPAP